MNRLLVLALLAAAIALAGCATVPAPFARSIDRTNGQPRSLPCMVGDALCH